MTDKTELFPRVPETALPASLLRAPLAARDPSDTARDPSAADPHALCEAMAPLISAAIARKARQRRYTP